MTHSALIIFSDTDGHFWWNRILKPGYRHVAVAIWDGFEWVIVLHQYHQLFIRVKAASDFHLQDFSPTHVVYWPSIPETKA